MSQVLYDVYNGQNRVQTYTDKKAAIRRVFAENCSYRKTEDRVWHLRERGELKRELLTHD